LAQGCNAKRIDTDDDVDIRKQAVEDMMVLPLFLQTMVGVLSEKEQRARRETGTSDAIIESWTIEPASSRLLLVILHVGFVMLARLCEHLMGPGVFIAKGQGT
jgi:hypothetical protein